MPRLAHTTHDMALAFVCGAAQRACHSEWPRKCMCYTQRVGGEGSCISKPLERVHVHDCASVLSMAGTLRKARGRYGFCFIRRVIPGHDGVFAAAAPLSTLCCCRSKRVPTHRAVQGGSCRPRPLRVEAQLSPAPIPRGVYSRMCTHFLQNRPRGHVHARAEKAA